MNPRAIVVTAFLATGSVCMAMMDMWIACFIWLAFFFIYCVVS